jgi:hypothetical protein
VNAPAGETLYLRLVPNVAEARLGYRITERTHSPLDRTGKTKDAFCVYVVGKNQTFAVNGTFGDCLLKRVEMSQRKPVWRNDRSVCPLGLAQKHHRGQQNWSWGNSDIGWQSPETTV